MLQLLCPSITFQLAINIKSSRLTSIHVNCLSQKDNCSKCSLSLIPFSYKYLLNIIQFRFAFCILLFPVFRSWIALTHHSECQTEHQQHIHIHDDGHPQSIRRRCGVSESVFPFRALWASQLANYMITRHSHNYTIAHTQRHRYTLIVNIMCWQTDDIFKLEVFYMYFCSRCRCVCVYIPRCHSGVYARKCSHSKMHSTQRNACVNIQYLVASPVGRGWWRWRRPRRRWRGRGRGETIKRRQRFQLMTGDCLF